MDKLRVLFDREVYKILAGHDFVEVRRRGSHVVMQQAESGSTLSVPMPDHKELRTGTLISIIRQLRLPRSKFE